MKPQLASTYVHLADDMNATLQPVTPEFWPSLMTNQRPDLEPGRLVMLFDFDCDWPTWEMHPAGDEVVVLISGAATFIIRTPDGDTSQTLDQPGEFVIVPRGLWHTAKVSTATSMLFMTPGRGTENRETPPSL